MRPIDVFRSWSQFERWSFYMGGLAFTIYDELPDWFRLELRAHLELWRHNGCPDNLAHARHETCNRRRHGTHEPAIGEDMVNEQTRQEMLALIHKHLPKRIHPERVTLEPTSTSLRVLLDGGLVWEYGHGVCGWCPIETTAQGGADIASVARAIRRATKEHP